MRYMGAARSPNLLPGYGDVQPNPDTTIYPCFDAPCDDVHCEGCYDEFGNAIGDEDEWDYNYDY